jgi:DNA polymerase-3 subunit epsilon
MLDWIKNIKELPEFWKTYLSKFDKKSNRYVVISTETTGLNPHKDVILSIGAFAVDDSLFISDSFEAILLQYKYLHDNNFQMNLLLKAR